MSCRTIRREIEEAGPGKWLSAEVNEHVASCMACETLLREQTSLRQLVASLGTVEAPSDFDFRLRARLAGEKRAAAESFSWGNFSFGARSAALATLMVVIGSAVMFGSFWFRSDDANLATTNSDASNAAKKVFDSAGIEISGSQKNSELAVTAVQSSSEPRLRPRTGSKQMQLASRQDNNRVGTRDLSSTGANVLKHDQIAGVYPPSAFPIDAGYQSLKVSLDNGRGTSRTISLPTVSFGSQRSLSQGASPLMASARGAW